MPSRLNLHTPLTVSSALGYALLLTVLYFAIDRSNLFGLSETRFNDQFFQSLLSLKQGAITWFKQSEPERDDEIPVVVLFSDKATALDKYGWPLRMMDLLELIEEAVDANAKAVYVDMVIRSADHDPIGFCYMIDKLAGMVGRGDLSKTFLPRTASGKPAGTCLEDLRALRQYAENRDANPASKWHYYGLDNTEQDSPRLIFGAPLGYLKARDNYYAKKLAADTEQENSSELDKEKADAWKTYQQAITDWPGVAYLDQVSLLAPMAISNEDGRGSHLWVDTNNFYSPAYIMACSQGVHGESEKWCTPEAEETLSDRVRYPIWSGTDDGWQSLGTTAGQFMSQYEACSKSWLQQIVAQLFSQLVQALGGMVSRCPYFPTLDMVNYANGSLPTRDFFSHRNVLIGTDMARFNDYVKSPLHGQVPGVYLHAVNLDNLVRDQHYYFTVGPSGHRFWIKLLFSKYVIFFGMCWLFLLFNKDTFIHFGAAKKNMALFFGVFFFSAMCFFVVSYLSRLEGNVDKAAVIIVFLVSAYLLAVLTSQYWLRFLGPGGESKTWFLQRMSARYFGLLLCLPHFLVIVVGSMLILVFGAVVAYVAHLPPPDVTSVLLVLGPFYMIAARDDLGEGLSMLPGNRRVYDTFDECLNV